MEKKAANKNLINEEVRNQILLNGGDGNTIQALEAGINDRTNKEIKIYEIESIRTIGKGMKELEPNGMFYFLFNQLKVCSNFETFLQFLLDLSVNYIKFCNEEGLLSIEEIIELLKLAENKDNLQSIISAIMMFSVCA